MSETVSTGRVIAFDRSRGRGIVDIDGRAVVVDASVVDASHLVAGDEVEVRFGDRGRIRAVTVANAATLALPHTTRELFHELLGAQNGPTRKLVEALAHAPDLVDHVRAWLERWHGPVRFWEPNNVAALIDRRREPEMTAMLEQTELAEGPDDRRAWLAARLITRRSCRGR